MIECLVFGAFLFGYFLSGCVLTCIGMGGETPMRKLIVKLCAMIEILLKMCIVPLLVVCLVESAILLSHLLELVNRIIL